MSDDRRNWVKVGLLFVTKSDGLYSGPVMLPAPLSISKSNQIVIRRTRARGARAPVFEVYIAPDEKRKDG